MKMHLVQLCRHEKSENEFNARYLSAKRRNEMEMRDMAGVSHSFDNLMIGFVYRVATAIQILNYG
jgi:hypothetical protein